MLQDVLLLSHARHFACRCTDVHANNSPIERKRKFKKKRRIFITESEPPTNYLKYLHLIENYFLRFWNKYEWKKMFAWYLFVNCKDYLLLILLRTLPMNSLQFTVRLTVKCFLSIKHFRENCLQYWENEYNNEFFWWTSFRHSECAFVVSYFNSIFHSIGLESIFNRKFKYNPFSKAC